uniref:Iron ABC transporter permease n=1 Tax=Caldilinea aerophila TaxID=133453 RepID=A0A7C1K1C1_9CHLR
MTRTVLQSLSRRPPGTVDSLRRCISGLKRPGSRRLEAWSALSLLIAAIVVLPIAVVALALLSPTPEVWRHLWNTRLPEMLSNTLVLIVGVGLGTLVLGTGLAWLVVAYRFPGRALFDWLLLLPLAIPSYVLAFVYMATLDFAGPVQTALRNWFGSSAWFPEIRSGGGTVLVMTLVFYPYVYLLARAAFHEQAATTFEAARVLGYSRWKAFLRVVLPMARPSIVAGLSLVLMEVLTDLGTVRFLNFPTLTDGIFRIWHGMIEREAAMELAGLLLLFALGALLLERRLRGRARYYQTGNRSQGIAPVHLFGWRAWAATGTCTLVLSVTFFLPVGRLVAWAVSEVMRGTPGALDALYWDFTRNSLILSGTAAGIAVSLAVILVNGVRISKHPLSRLAARWATLGYAAPGAVIALGVLIPLAALDHMLNELAAQWWGVFPGLLFTGSIIGLLYAYVVRFMAVAYFSVESSLEKVTPNMEDAARTLGASPWRVLRRIHLPLIRAGMFTGAVLVFVEVMKELPATLLLRPFGYNSLAIRVWQDVSESLWASAALPALTIVLVGLLPVVLLMRAATSDTRPRSEEIGRLYRERTGQEDGASARIQAEPALFRPGDEYAPQTHLPQDAHAVRTFTTRGTKHAQ